MSTMGRPRSYSPELCELAHNDCLLGATDDEVAEFFGVIDDIALLDAAGASVRHAGDRARARPLGETAKPAAERAERAETSNPWEIAAFSTTARGGGNWRKLAETPCRDFAREIVRGLANTPRSVRPVNFRSGLHPVGETAKPRTDG
jgi:hypothetical protein